MKFKLLFLYFLICSACVVAQSNYRKVNGKIVSRQTSEPISLATIQVSSQKTGVVSDSLGKFEIIISEQFFNDTLLISHVGYINRKIKIETISNKIEIFLEEDTIKLSDANVGDSERPAPFATMKDIRKAKKQNASLFYKISIDSAINKAENENKHVLLYFSTAWCGPCNFLQVKVFPDSIVREKLLEKYVPLKFDGDALASEKIKKEFQVAGYPTFIVIDNQKQIRKKKFGGVANKDEFLTFLQEDLAETPVEISEIEIQVIAIKKKASPPFKPNFGADIGINATEQGGRFSSSFFVSMEKKRYLIRPKINYSVTHFGTTKAQLLNIPVDLGFSFYKGMLFSVPGGFNAIASPYYGIILNDIEGEPKNDYGLRYGIECYIGGDSKIGMSLLYNHGMKDVVSEGQVYQNRGLTLSLFFMLAN